MAWLMPWVMETVLPLGFRLLRALPWNPRFGQSCGRNTLRRGARGLLERSIVSRAPTRKISKSSWAGIRSFLSMDDTEEYRRDTGAMRKVIRVSDIPARLIPEVERPGRENRSRREWAARGRGCPRCDGSRSSCIALYFGIPNPPGEDLRVLATPAVRIPVRRYRRSRRCAPKSMSWRRSCALTIRGLMEARRASGQNGG